MQRLIDCWLLWVIIVLTDSLFLSLFVQTGFPLIELEEVEDASQPDSLQFRAKQSRFMQEGPDANSAALWPVPIDFLLGGQGSNQAVSKQILAERSGTLSVDLKVAGVQGGKPKWVKLNAGQVGMFRVRTNTALQAGAAGGRTEQFDGVSRRTLRLRGASVLSIFWFSIGARSFVLQVRYPPRMFAALCDAVKARDPLLSAADRLGVQNDAFALTRCGLLTTVQLLELVQSFESEDEYTVWADLLGNLSDISLLLQSQPEVFANFAAYVNRLTAKIAARVGWEKAEGEGHTLSLLRAKIIGVTAKYNAQATIDTGLEKFTAYVASGQATAAGAKEGEEEKKAGAAPAASLSPDLRSAVYGIAVKHGAHLGYATMLHLLDKAPTSEEQVRCLQSLAAAADPKLLQRTLLMALSPKVRTQDGPSLIAAVAANPVGAPLYWQFCKDNWDGQSRAQPHVQAHPTLEAAAAARTLDSLSPCFAVAVLRIPLTFFLAMPSVFVWFVCRPSQEVRSVFVSEPHRELVRQLFVARAARRGS